ncbi:MAG: VCBS repeat-containing protein, partial [Verrucomicrobiota bacterium]
DVDGDGRLDIYFCGMQSENRLYRNRGGWRFEDITERAGVQHAGQFSTGAVFADIDGDHDLDLFVTTLGGDHACYLNDGSGRFEPTDRFDPGADSAGTTMALADIDADGDLDLYLTRYKVKPAKLLFNPEELVPEKIAVREKAGVRLKSPYHQHYIIRTRNGRNQLLETAEPDGLFINDDGRFFHREKIEGPRFKDEAGQPARAAKGWGLTAKFHDLNGDGLPDLYVCNDFWTPDEIWLNDGEGGFRAIDPVAVRHTSMATMSVDFSDIDRDGDVDFFLTDMLSRDYKRRKIQMGAMSPTPLAIGAIENRPQYMRNMLFLNRGDSTWAETAWFSGLEASEWSWASLFFDVDLDGYEDLFITTGHLHDIQDSDMDTMTARMEQPGDGYRADLLLLYPALSLTNLFFRNRGDLTFEETGRAWGLTEGDFSHGAATADLDNDGDLDL